MTEARTRMVSGALALFGIALVVNAALAYFIATPGTMDAAYYYGGALRLVRGHGFTEPYLWNYLAGVRSLPAPGFLYWMPLTSIVSAAAMSVLGATYRAAQVPLVLAASALPVLTYQLGKRWSIHWRASFTAGLLVIFSGFFSLFWTGTDSFALFALLGALTLMAGARAADSGQARICLAAGVLAGAAHLTRADGVLLLIVLLGALARARQRWALLAAAVAGYGLVMTPWFIRNFMVAGTPLAPGAARSVWLTTYEDLFRYPADAITPNAYLAQGIRGVARGKLWVLGQNLQTLVAVQGMVFLGPFMVVGLWQLRAQRLARMAVAYLGLLFFTMTFVFSFPGARGGLFHSGAALVPVLAVAAVYGVDHVVTWVAARRRSWEAQRARAVFRGGVVALAVGLTAMLIFVRVVQGDWSHSDRLLARVGAQLPAGSVVASNNPPGLYAAAGLAGVFIPTGTESTLGAVVAQYGVDYVLLDENHVPALAPLYARQRRPDYLCPPLTPAPGVLLFPVAPCD